MTANEALQTLKTDLITHLAVSARMSEDRELARVAAVLLERAKANEPLFSPVPAAKG